MYSTHFRPVALMQEVWRAASLPSTILVPLDAGKAHAQWNIGVHKYFFSDKNVIWRTYLYPDVDDLFRTSEILV